MPRWVWALLGGALGISLALVPVERAGACSVCLAGDPFLDAGGTTVQPQGQVSVSLQVRGWTKESGLLPHGEEEGHGRDGHEDAEERALGSARPRHDGGHDDEPEPGHDDGDEHADGGHADSGTEKSRGRRLDLFVSWTPLDRLTLTLDVPWAWNQITEKEGGASTTSRLSGLGDVSLAASGVLWRNRPALPSTWLEGRLFVKFPTGKSSQEVNGVQDPHLQPGTGSWDSGFGLAAVHRLPWASLYGSVFYRVNTEGSLDYEYGDVFLANAAIQVPLGHALDERALDRVTAGFELNYRWAAYDESDGERYRDSGGSILYLTPSLRVRLPWPWGTGVPSLRASVQVPATNAWLHGFQDEDPVWFAGIQADF